MAEKRLYRARDGRLGGVCAGIAERYDFDPIVVRILAVLLAVATVGVAALAYLAMWARIPLEPDGPEPYEVMPAGAESSVYGSMPGVIDASLHFASPSPRPRTGRGLSVIARLAIAVGLMLVFLAVSMNASPVSTGVEWWQFWPVALLVPGLCLIIIPVNSPLEAVWHAAGIVVTAVSASLLPMSLGVLSWSTIPYSFAYLWPLVAVAIGLAALGLYRAIDSLVVIAAFCIVAFCLMMLLFYALPGNADALVFVMPNGNSYSFDV